MLLLSHMHFSFVVSFCIHCLIHCRRVSFVATFSSYETKKGREKARAFGLGFVLLTSLEKECALVGTLDNNGKS